MSFDLTQKIKIVNPHANNDDLYGTYTSKAEALSSVSLALREIGRTVGIIENGEIKEYWFKAGISDSDLVEKADFNEVATENSETITFTGKGTPTNPLSAESNTVVSINGKKGIVNLTTTDVPEGTNYYYTDTRVKAYADTLYSSLNHTHTWSDIEDTPTLTNSDNTVLIDNFEINSNTSVYTDEFTYTSVAEKGIVTTIFNLSFIPTVVLGVYVNGLRLKRDEFTIIEPQILSLTREMEDNDFIIITYLTNVQ